MGRVLDLVVASKVELPQFSKMDNNILSIVRLPLLAIPAKVTLVIFGILPPFCVAGLKATW